MDGGRLGRIIQWADPSIPDPLPDPYENGVTDDELRAHFNGPTAPSRSRMRCGSSVSQGASAGSNCPPDDLWNDTSLSRFRPSSAEAALLTNAGIRRMVSLWSRSSTYHLLACCVLPFESR